MRKISNTHLHEQHSADGHDFIDHTGDGAWVVVWRGVNRTTYKTREIARRVIRTLKRTRPGQQLSFSF